jgi:hypothetical protein
MNTNPETFNPYDSTGGYDCGDTYESNFPADEPEQDERTTDYNSSQFGEPR